jgi:hypothetical protein
VKLLQSVMPRGGAHLATDPTLEVFARRHTWGGEGEWSPASPKSGAWFTRPADLVRALRSRAVTDKRQRNSPEGS